MAKFPAALAHGAFEEIFPNVWQVTGSFRFMPGFTIPRNMQIARQGQDLVLINSVRLTDAGEKALEALGRVAHVIRIGGFHGADDPYYAHRFGATMWAPKGMTHKAGIRYQELSPGMCPIEGASVFVFEHGTAPEAMVLLAAGGGTLVTCDAYQNWLDFDDCSFLGRVVMRRMGFGPAHIGGPWAKRMGRGVLADFERLLELDFAHLLPGHGAPLRDRAKEALPAAIKARFG